MLQKVSDPVQDPMADPPPHERDVQEGVEAGEDQNALHAAFFEMIDWKVLVVDVTGAPS